MNTTSKPFIIDEWLWHDLSRENGEEKLEEAFKFLKFLYEKCDKIATIKDSRFEEKFFNFCERSDHISRKITNFYKSYIFYNSEKYIGVNENECPQIPEDISPKIKPDDQYLVELYYKLQCPIITTDNTLLEISGKHQIQCEHRDNFLPHYIGEQDRQQ